MLSSFFKQNIDEIFIVRIVRKIIMILNIFILNNVIIDFLTEKFWKQL